MKSTLPCIPFVKNEKYHSFSQFFDKEKERIAFNGQSLIWFGIHFLSSMGLTLCNKYVASSYPYPLHIIFLQNVSTILCTIIFTKIFCLLPMREFKLEHLVPTFPVTIFYIFLLWSSLEALGKISVPMMVVGRSVAPLLTLLGERILFGTTFSSNCTSSIILLLTGSFIYALHDFSVNASSFTWLVINVLLSGFVMPLIEKNLVKSLPDQTPAGINIYRNFLSLPFLLFLTYFRGEINRESFQLFFEIEYKSIVLISCFLGFSISIAYFFLQSLVPATNIVVAQVFYKLATVIIGFFVFPTVVYWQAWYGMIISFCGISLYTYSRVGSISSHSSKTTLFLSFSLVLFSLSLVFWTSHLSPEPTLTNHPVPSFPSSISLRSIGEENNYHSPTISNIPVSPIPPDDTSQESYELQLDRDDQLYFNKTHPYSETEENILSSDSTVEGMETLEYTKFDWYSRVEYFVLQMDHYPIR